MVSPEFFYLFLDVSWLNYKTVIRTYVDLDSRKEGSHWIIKNQIEVNRLQCVFPRFDGIIVFFSRKKENYVHLSNKPHAKTRWLVKTPVYCRLLFVSQKYVCWEFKMNAMRWQLSWLYQYHGQTTTQFAWFVQLLL